VSFYFKKKFHLLNNLWHLLLVLVTLLCNINNILNSLFKIIIKLFKINFIIEKIKISTKNFIFKLHDLNIDLFIYNFKKNKVC